MILWHDNRQLTDMTHSIIISYYGGRPTLILDQLHSDIVWINNLENQYLYGYYCVSSSLFRTPRPSQCRITFGHIHLMPLAEDTCIVTCEYHICAKGAEQEQYCSTFIWKYCNGRLKLLYVHMSSSGSIPRPPKVSPEILTVQGLHAQVHRIHTEDILYIEASDVYSQFCCTSGQVTANQSISSLEKVLPPFFMRTHRSFIANKQYVRKIFRYGLEMSNGISLPVPEKRYMQVVCWLET